MYRTLESYNSHGGFAITKGPHRVPAKKGAYGYSFGYQPIGYDWPNYMRVTSNAMIQHDLYHHQLNESGQLWEEFRAAGARYLFERTFDTGHLFDNLILPTSNKSVVDAPDEVLSLLAHKYTHTGNVNAYINLFMDGYNYATMFDRVAYDRFRNIDFLGMWRYSRIDVIVNLEDGTATHSPYVKISKK